MASKEFSCRILSASAADCAVWTLISPDRSINGFSTSSNAGSSSTKRTESNIDLPFLLIEINQMINQVVQNEMKYPMRGVFEQPSVYAKPQKYFPDMILNTKNSP